MTKDYDWLQVTKGFDWLHVTKDYKWLQVSKDFDWLQVTKDYEWLQVRIKERKTWRSRMISFVADRKLIQTLNRLIAFCKILS